MGVSKFDELLTILGTGKWNVIYFFITGYWYMWLPGEYFGGTYMAPELTFTCVPPENDSVSISSDSCSYFFNETTDSGNETLVERECTAWEYDSSVFTTTLTAEFDLVCSHAYKKATFQSALVFATIFTSPFAGYLADRFGRKRVVVVSQTLFFIASLSTSLANNFSSVLALRFFTGALLLPTTYVLAMEVCEIKTRSLVGILIGFPWAIGTMIWGGLAYLIRDWRYLKIAVVLPQIVLFPCLYYIDESPRWLILKGYHDRALKVLHKAAQWNKVNLPPDEELEKMFLDIQTEQAQADKPEMKKSMEKNKRIKIPVPTLLGTPKIRQIMALMCTMDFMVAFAYTGVSLSGNIYGDDPFLFMVILGATQMPSYSFTAPLIKWFGRKRPVAACFIIGGISMLPLGFVPSHLNALVLTLAMIGMLCVSSAWMMKAVYTTELLPTEVRMQGMGTTMLFSQVAATLTPYIAMYLGPLMPWLPSIFYGAACFIAAAAMLPLRETKGAPMLETIEELEFQSKKRLNRCDTTEKVDESTKFDV